MTRRSNFRCYFKTPLLTEEFYCFIELSSILSRVNRGLVEVTVTSFSLTPKDAGAIPAESTTELSCTDGRDDDGDGDTDCADDDCKNTAACDPAPDAKEVPSDEEEATTPVPLG